MSSAWVEVDSFSLTQNAKMLRRMIGDSFFWANVSNNGYGHDLKIAAEAFWRGGIDGFVVVNPDDAGWLRQRFKLPVLVLFPLSDSDLARASEQDWHVAVTSESYFERLAHYARTHGKLFRVHYELDTGGSTTGLKTESLTNILRHQADIHPLLVPCGLFTQIIDPKDEENTRLQLLGLREFQFNLQRERIIVPPTHALTSETLIRWGESFLFDGVRIGEAVYGLNREYPGTTTGLTVKTTVISTQSVKAGEHVGYRPRALTNRLTRLAVIEMGYRSGLDRRIRDNGVVLIRGQRCPYTGGIGPYVSVVDINRLATVNEGEEVTILGSSDKASVSPFEMEDWIGHPPSQWINQLTGFLPRIKSK